MDIRDIKIELDYECWDCENKEGRKLCDTCHGTGFLLTDQGQELVEFMEHHFHITRIAGPER